MGDIRAGYRWAATKWHPQKNPSTKVEAEQRFRDIAEAYDVLINPLRRQRYDELGERGLKFPSVDSQVEPYQYVGDPFGLFASFMGEASPLTDGNEQVMNGHTPSLDPKERDQTIEVEVQCSTSDFQDGATRRVEVERTRIGPGNKPFKESKLITLPIRSNWVAGMRVTFP